MTKPEPMPGASRAFWVAFAVAEVILVMVWASLAASFAQTTDYEVSVVGPVIGAVGSGIVFAIPFALVVGWIARRVYSAAAPDDSSAAQHKPPDD